LSVPRPRKNEGRACTTTLAPSRSGGSHVRNSRAEHVTVIETSADGSRNVRNDVCVPGRAEIWVICPSTHTEPSRWIQSAILRATVRTGHGLSAVEGAVPPRGRSAALLTVRGPLRLAHVVDPAGEHPDERRAIGVLALVGEKLLQLRQGQRPQPRPYLGECELVVARHARGGLRAVEFTLDVVSGEGPFLLGPRIVLLAVAGGIEPVVETLVEILVEGRPLRGFFGATQRRQCVVTLDRQLGDVLLHPHGHLQYL